MIRRRLAPLAAAVLVLASASCGSDGSRDHAGAEPADGPPPHSGTVTVFAAASLKRPFTAIGKEFESARPGTTVKFNFAGSSDLVAQLEQGAPADVFASADARNMDRAVAGSMVLGTPVIFATNTLQIAVPPGNPAGVSSLADLAKSGVALVVCAPQVPCGAAAVRVEQAAAIDLRPVSEEQSVTDVLGKVTTGEADAGLVYVTDVLGAGGKVTGIPIAESSTAVNSYPVARLTDSVNPALAEAFVEAVTGVRGQAVLAAAGFAKAP